MPAPLIGAAVIAAGRILAGQAAKKGVVRLSQRAASQAVNKSARGGRVVSRATGSTRNVRLPKGRLTVAEKDRLKKIASDRLSTRNVTQLSRDMTKVKINPAALGGRVKSGKPAPNRGGGLRTTTGQGKKKTSKADVYEAVRTMSQRPGGSSTTTGTGAVRGTAPKPGVRVVNITGSGTKVTGGIKRTTNKKGGAVTVRKIKPRSREDIKAQKERAQRDKLREVLTVRVNPARPKTTPKRGEGGSGRNKERSQEILDRYYRIRFGDKGGPTPRSQQGRQGSIESRIASGSEKAPQTRGRGNKDFEADELADRSIRAIESPKIAAKERVRPGKRTNVAKAVKNPKARNVGKAIANQRRVLREREIKETAERMRKAEEAAKKRGSK